MVLLFVPWPRSDRICRADWSSRGGYGNAPAEFIKRGDTLDRMMDRGLISHGGSGAARTEVEE